MVAGGSVVDWGEAPSHAPGPNSANYEAFRELCGAHLVYNAFWNVKHFCVHQMLMRDPMHQVDLGAIVHLIKAILTIHVSDPSAECISVVHTFLTWYHLYRRRNPPKDEDDIKELTNLARRYLILANLS